MRLLVGILHTVENEFEECVASVQKQTHQDFECLVIHNLPCQKAHETLYQSFIDRANDFDLLLKLDADLVIESPNLFAEIVKKFQKNPDGDLYEIAVHDFFSDQLIWGMPFYRNTLQWWKNEDPLFYGNDLCPIPRERRISDNHDLAPAAIHCKNPSLLQAFHYGVARGLFVIQPHRKKKLRFKMTNHWNLIRRTWANFEKSRDVRLGLAVLGAELAYQGQFLPKHLNYSDPYVSHILKPYENFTAAQIHTEIRRLRRRNFGFLPHRLRREVVSFRQRGFFKKSPLLKKATYSEPV